MNTTTKKDNMNQVTITIAGPAGSGKSTIAQMIARQLSNVNGFDVVVFDEDGSSNDWDHDRIENSLDRLSEHTAVTVSTVQSLRSGK